MIQMETNLDVADNSGARRVQCIKVLGGSKRKYATIGDTIVVSVQGGDPAGPRQEGPGDEGRRGAHGQGRAPSRRLADPLRPQRRRAHQHQGEPVGTRIFGPVTRELRAKNHMKIVSLAPEVL